MAKTTEIAEAAKLVDQTSDASTEDIFEGQTKSALLSLATHSLAGMEGDQIKFFLKSLEPVGASGIPDGAAAKNKASVAMKGAIAEDLANVFGEDETLSEDVRTRIGAIFEAAVDVRADEIRVELEDKYTTDVEAKVAEIASELAEEVQSFLEYATKQFMEENEVAIDKSLRADLAENILNGFHDVLSQNFVKVPEEKVDIAEALASEVEALNDERNDLIESNIELTAMLKEYARKETIAEHVVGMTDVQADRFLKVANTISFDGDTEAFGKKLAVIKESNFVKTSKEAKTGLVLDESIDAEGTEATEAAPKNVDPDFARFQATHRRLNPR